MFDILRHGHHSKIRKQVGHVCRIDATPHHASSSMKNLRHESNSPALELTLAHFLCLLHTQLSIMAALAIINRASIHPRRLQSLHIWRNGLGLALVEMFMIERNHKSGQYYCGDD